MSLPRIAVTMGDPAGVGPEICLRLLSDHSLAECCYPVIVGDATVLQRVQEETGIARDLELTVIAPSDWSDVLKRDAARVILDVGAADANAVSPGVVDAATGRASYEYIAAAIELAMSQSVDGVTTAPIHKEAFASASVPYAGHTELFADRTASERTCMMLTSREITCSLVTTHVGLKDVPGLLTSERIVEVIQLSHDAMRTIRGREPRLAVCGLNPHAGEHGLFGDGEEERIIMPAIETARKEGISIAGPLPPDTAFLPARRSQTDCYICMYHDQGLIPLKALAFDLGVNLTLGLPIVRTSVDHGTALDIAWQGKAESSSLSEAVRLAAQLATGR